MKLIKLIAGIAWASPVTLANFLLHILFFWIIGAYTFIGRYEYALVWAVKDTAPRWVKNLWSRFNGNSVGNIIVISRKEYINSTRLMIHEMEHARQNMRFGIFGPILYGIFFVACACINHVEAYKDNPFEVAARAAAEKAIQEKNQS